MEQVKISWEEHLRLIEALAEQVKKVFAPNQIVCIATGGLIPGMILSKIFKAPLAILSAESYKADVNGVKNQKGEVVFSRDLAKTRPGFGNKILLIDDLTDTGDTMAKSLEWLKNHYGEFISELKTAVIWHKNKSVFRPDFIVEEFFPDADGQYPWIVQPLEKYETQ